MDNNKKMQKMNNRKMEQLEKIRLENEMTEYFNTVEYAIELEIDNRELLHDVITDILKF